MFIFVQFCIIYTFGGSREIMIWSDYQVTVICLAVFSAFNQIEQKSRKKQKGNVQSKCLYRGKNHTIFFRPNHSPEGNELTKPATTDNYMLYTYIKTFICFPFFFIVNRNWSCFTFLSTPLLILMNRPMRKKTSNW